jgi:hypothetical protein
MSYLLKRVGSLVILAICGIGCAAADDPALESGAAALEAGRSWTLDDGLSADVVLRLTQARAARHVFRQAMPNIETLVVDVTCEASDRCSGVDRGGESAALFSVTAEAGVHLSGDLLRSGAPGEASAGRVSTVRLVCETDNGAHARCAASTRVGTPSGNVLLTGVGSMLSWTTAFRQIDSGSTFTHVATYDVTYTDAGGYFGDAPLVSLTVVPTTSVAHHGGLPDAPRTTSFDSTLKKVGPHTYAGTFDLSLSGATGDSQTDLVHLGVAFSGAGTWDSNLGRNYDL